MSLINLQQQMHMQDIKAIMQQQPIINVGTIGHVANGKSTLVKSLTSKTTQQFSKEKERNITIRLGYANAKIWKCIVCSSPQKYSASDSCMMNKSCSECKTDLELVSHISIVDCPGHNELTSTMLNGSSVMDYAILVEACNNANIPAPQTDEHLVATKTANIPTCMVVMNKIDLVKKDIARSQIEKISEYIKKKTGLTLENMPPIIPVSATFGINIDIICQRLSQLTVPAARDRSANFKMIVIRSFDVNKPGTDVCKLNGGVIGGTIMRGTLKLGDKINIYPGMVSDIPENEKTAHGADFRYEPICGNVLSIKSDTNELKYAIPGGLLGIQLTIDPAFAKSDHLSGSLVIKCDDIDTKVHVYDKIIVSLTTILDTINKIEDLLKKNLEMIINVNSNNIVCIVHKYNHKKRELFLTLSRPVAIDTVDNHVTLINKNAGNGIIGRGEIIDGVDCESMC